MERPQGSWQPPQRQMTGEVLYFQDAQANGQRIAEFSKLPESAQQQFEKDAQTMRSLGAKSDLLLLYEQHDIAPSPLSVSCRALAEALLALEGSEGENNHANVRVVMDSSEILDKLSTLRIAELIAPADEQLALPPESAEAEEVDFKKVDARFIGVGLDIWHEVQPRNDGMPPESMPYPADEKSHRFSLDLSLQYLHPVHGSIVETLSLHIDSAGGIMLASQIESPVYEQAMANGYKAKKLESVTDTDTAAFADLIAEVVGDEPETVAQHSNRTFRETVAQMPNTLSQRYIQEWLNNTSDKYVRMLVRLTSVEGRKLQDLLLDPETADQAHEVLVGFVEADRTRRLTAQADGHQHPNGPWLDLVER